MSAAAYMTTEDVAVILNRSVRWTRENLLLTGRIRCLRVGRELRVKPDDFRAWERSVTISAGAETESVNQDAVRSAVRKLKGE